MKVLVACEESQIVTGEFRRKGHEAYSCDVLPTRGRKEWHIQDDVLRVLGGPWDLIIAFPPCTHLSVSGARWFPQKREDGRQQEAIDFFMEFTNTGRKFVIENPVGIMSTIYRKPDQIIQPWMFGEDASKRTCLWLNGVEKLEIDESKVLRKELYSNQTPSRQSKVGETKKRSMIRSQTYPKIARAMARQWG